MRMRDNGEWSAQQSVTGCKTGHRFDVIELDVTDFMRLREMRDGQLRGWLDNWACGFVPLRQRDS